MTTANLTPDEMIIKKIKIKYSTNIGGAERI